MTRLSDTVAAKNDPPATEIMTLCNYYEQKNVVRLS